MLHAMTGWQVLAHHEHYVAQADAEQPGSDHPPQVAATESSGPSQIDRQIAFFEYEMLMHLALRAPTPCQQELIDLGWANQRFAERVPEAKKLQELKELREPVLRLLREDFAVRQVEWTDEGIVVLSSAALELAQGLERTILLEVANKSSAFIDISCRQAGDEDASDTKYTIHQGRSAFLPITVRANSLEDSSLQFEATVHNKPERDESFSLAVQVERAATIRGTIFDADSQQPWPGRVYVLGSDRMYRHGGTYANSETLTQKELLQFWNMGRYYKLPFFYSDGTFEIQVPPGKTELTLERGFEHEVVTRSISLKPGEVRQLEISSGRLVDMQQQGWVSGDTHVHWVTNQWNVDLPLEVLSTVQRAEDLRVANNLTLLQRGPSLAFINPAQAPMGTVEKFSDDQFHIEMGEEYRNEDLYGHLCFLNLDWLVQPIGTGSIIAGPDALDYPINKTAILACREQGGISCEAHGLGGNKDVPVNVVHGLTDSLDQIHPHEYYDFLDCGFHLPLTNGSDHPARVLGCARAYVHVDGDFTYDKWIDGIRQCRTFTTSGPLLFLKVNDSEIGDTLQASAEDLLHIRAEVVSRYPVGNFQVVSNGQVISEKQVPGNEAIIEMTIPASESRWVVARCSPTDNYNAIEQANVAHTSAVYVDVAGKPRFVPSTARRWIGQMRKHIRDIRAKGRFANDLQMQEAIDYVEEGIERYESLIQAAEADRNPTAKKVRVPIQLVSNETTSAAWPLLDTVESQPLLVQVERLTEALDYIGNPLSEGVKVQLQKLQDDGDPRRIAAKVQSLLDQLCLAAVDINKGKLSVVRREGQHELVEKGWRSFLVKVCNRSNLTARLRVESPNARSMPHAKQEDVAARWLGLSTFDGRPLQANLSGLELEYRVIQLYSRDAGEKSATLDFSVDAEPGKRGRQIREWRFDEDTDGWHAMNQSEIEAREGALHVTSTGQDPFIGADVGGVTGELVLRFWAETSDEGVGQIHWWTEERPSADSQREINFPLLPGGGQLYEIVIPCEGVLAGIRIDPNVKRSTMRFDWIDLCYARRQGETWNSVPMQFDVQPAVPVKLKVVDKPGEPAVAALDIRDHLGRVYPEQTKRLAPDFFFHPQIYRMDGETLHLPPGDFTVRCWRGPHSIPETKRLVVGTEPTELRYTVRRWIDPTEFGWWSGDHHIHAAGCLHYVSPTEGVLPQDMLRQTMGEDMNVGCCLTWGPCFDYQKQFFTGMVDKVSQYPYLIRYDVEVSGFGSHASGHLNLLRLKEQIPPGGDSKHHWPTLGLNTLRWAKRQGAICGPAHSANGLSNYVGRLEPYEDGPGGLPHFNIPAFDGIGANEYIVDVTHKVMGPDDELIPAVDFISAMNTPRQDEWNMWYHTLNCGFRMRVSGETDFPCMSGERVGMGRVYIKVPGRLTYDDWVQGIQDGRSYVSDGIAHLIDFEARVQDTDTYLQVGDDDSELTVAGPVTFECRAKCAALLPESKDAGGVERVAVELLANGYPVALAEIPANGSLQDVQLQARVERSSWLAMRVFPHAHTNPFFVVVDGKPIRASRASAQWCLECVDQCWKEKHPTYDIAEQEDARLAYEHAKRIYRTILEECEE